MKSKVLSFVLALTLLCSIMVPTAAFAAVDKGDEIVLEKSNFVVGTDSNGKVAHSDKQLPIKDVNGSCIIGVSNNTIKKSGYEITPAIDLTKPFTFEYEYYALDKVLSFFSFGSKDVFVTTDTGSVYLNGAVCSGVTAPFNGWNKVLFNYDGNQYGVYLNGNLLKSRFTLTESSTTLKVGVYGQTFPDTGTTYERLYIDEVYAYEEAYKPDGTPLVEKDVITLDAKNPNVTASATFSEDRIGDTFYLAVYNRIGETDYLQLIGIDKVVIEEAGLTQLKLSFPDNWGYVHRIKAFVWEDDCTPTDIYGEIIGR